jgi:tryptophanyl-tRNA synthetase
MNRSYCRFTFYHANKNGELLERIPYTAAAWLGLWVDVKSGFYRQSDVPQTAELSWYLSCFFLSTFDISTSFKDKA